MKKVNVTVAFDDGKLDALTYFMRKDNTDPQKALLAELNKLYEKYIPAELRGYLESRTSSQSRDRSKRPARPAGEKAATQGAAVNTGQRSEGGN